MSNKKDTHTHNIRDVVQCKGYTNSGARCKRRTARTQYCYYHLEKVEHVKIKPSKIPGAGMGLFTTIKRPAHRLVASYSGELVSRKKNDYGGDYVIQLSNKPPYKYVDGRKTSSSAGRFSNMARRGDKGVRNNAHLAPDYKHPGQAKVVSNNKAIPANREVFTSYGRSYWS